MDCELCSSAGPGGGATRCQRCGFDTTLPPDVKRFLVSLTGFRPGELLEGRYRIDRILGYGGMSVVYKARDEVLGEDVAIKVINRGRVGDDNKMVTDIKRDIVTTRKLAHPDIVKIYDFHKGESCGFLTMEFVPGKDLASLITERGKLGEAEVCRMAAQVAEALHYAHTNGVIHCDIKPANLMLAGDGRLKIADFGISRVMQEESSGLTGLVVGTPAYMAPEQIRGERPGPRTDMYALGIVMWHCLMGSAPYLKGDIAYQHVHVPLPPMTGVGADLERVVRRAAGKAAEDRYPSMAVMAHELREILSRTAPAPDATVVASAVSGSAATIMQAAPPAPAGTVLLTPPPEEPGTVAQSQPVADAGTLLRTALPVQAGTVVQAPVPEPPPAKEQAPPRQPEGAAAGARIPPISNGPGGGVGQPSPAAPAASSGVRTAAVAAVVVLLAGAAAWGFFSRSSESGKPSQPQQASVGGLPPTTTPPPVATTATPPPERPVPAATPAATPRASAVGAAGVAGTAGSLAAAVVAGSAQVNSPPPAGTAVQKPTATPASPGAAAAVPVVATVAAVAPTPRSAEPQMAPPTPARVPEPTPAPPPAAPTAVAVSTAASQQPMAPADSPVPARTPPAPAQAPVTTPAPVEPAMSSRPAEPEREPVRAPAPAARVLDLTPIQLTALPRGRWCDVQVRAVGTGLPMASARSEAERRLTAERSAELDAYRRISENVKGLQVSGGSTVKDFITTDASYRTRTDAFIRGARRVDSQKNADGTWSVVMELNLAGMCDVIQAGTP